LTPLVVGVHQPEIERAPDPADGVYVGRFRVKLRVFCGK
jgi:hypothetical protein